MVNLDFCVQGRQEVGHIDCSQKGTVPIIVELLLLNNFLLKKWNYLMSQAYIQAVIAFFCIRRDLSVSDVKEILTQRK
jgi:uncharacterized protein YbgA (DUF1722 family)